MLLKPIEIEEDEEELKTVKENFDWFLENSGDVYPTPEEYEELFSKSKRDEGENLYEELSEAVSKFLHSQGRGPSPQEYTQIMSIMQRPGDYIDPDTVPTPIPDTPIIAKRIKVK